MMLLGFLMDCFLLWSISSGNMLVLVATFAGTKPLLNLGGSRAKNKLGKDQLAKKKITLIFLFLLFGGLAVIERLVDEGTWCSRVLDYIIYG